MYLRFCRSVPLAPIKRPNRQQWSKMIAMPQSAAPSSSPSRQIVSMPMPLPAHSRGSDSVRRPRREPSPIRSQGVRSRQSRILSRSQATGRTTSWA